MTMPASPPQHALSYQSTVGQNTSAVWRDGYLVVATKEAKFPDRCIKCNAPATRYYKRKLTWHNPFIYLVILANILIYALVAMAVQKKGTVYIALCPRHASKRTTLIAVGWGLFALAILFTILAIAFESAVCGLLIPLFVLASLILLVINSRFVNVSKIDERFVYLKGVNKDFMLALPAEAPSHAELDQIVVQQLQKRP